jgi:hypothetical protein
LATASLQLLREIEFKQHTMHLAHRDASRAGDFDRYRPGSSKSANDPARARFGQSPAQPLTVVQWRAERGEGASRPRSDLLRANPSLLASEEASDVVGVAPIEKHGEDQEQNRDARSANKEEQADDGGARHEGRKR